MNLSRREFLVDHCLNLAAEKQYDAILGDMVALAKVPNLYAKLSHVVTGSAEQYPFRDMHDSCRQILCETPRRLGFAG